MSGSNRRPVLWRLSTAFASVLIGSNALAQVIKLPPYRPPTAVAAPPAPQALAPAPQTVAHIPEGTEVRVRLEDPLSSSSASEGDTFTISTDEEIRLSDGTIIPAGFRGRGEVADVHKKEMLGKGGSISARLDYIRIGNTRVRLRANKSREGGDTTTTTVVLTLFVSVFFLMHHGHDAVIPKGTTIIAYVDEDADVPLPIPSPPPDD